MNRVELIARARQVLTAHRVRHIDAKQETPAAVMALIVPDPSDPDQAALLFIKRTADPGPHSGQVAFPGGKAETGETAEDTAWREAHEEVGLAPEHTTLLGQLDDTQTMTGFVVSAFVGAVDTAHPPWRPDPGEIAEVFTVPWSAIADRHAWTTMTWQHFGTEITLPCFWWEDKVIWGLTARIVTQLIELIAIEAG